MTLRGKRKEDSRTTRIWARSDRLFEEASRWHFYTREGTVEGPFTSRPKALERLDVYIGLMQAGPSSNAADEPNFQLQPR